MRYAEKRGRGWTGYKVHISRDLPFPGASAAAGLNLITSTETTLAPVTDVEMTEPVHDTLDARGLLPGEHAVDTGYASARWLCRASRDGNVASDPPEHDKPDTGGMVAMTGGRYTPHGGCSDTQS